MFEKSNAQVSANLPADVSLAKRLLIATAQGALLPGLVLSLGYSENLVRPIGRISEVVPRAADGDLTGSTGVIRKDELGSLAAGLDKMAAQMGHLAGEVKKSAEMVDEVLRKLLSGNNEVVTASKAIADMVGQLAQGNEEASAEAAAINRRSGNINQDIKWSASCA